MFFVRAWAEMALRLNLDRQSRNLGPAASRECEFRFGRRRGFRGEQRLYMIAQAAKVVFNIFNVVLSRSGFVLVATLQVASD